MANSLENGLYTVATPIGNLDDITLRAIDVLKNVDLILAEDTRASSVLLKKYDIKTKVISYHKFNENQKVDEIIDELKQNKKIALITDAGTPLISDPGNILVKKAIENNLKIIPIVGACAVIGLLQSVYRKGEDFKFVGFLPKNKSKIVEIIEKNRFENLIFYESPNRIIDSLNLINDNFPSKKVAIARELTKKFEEIMVLNISDAIKKVNPKGEFAVMILKDEESKNIDLDCEIKKLKALNYSNKDIANILSTLFDINKNLIKKVLK